MFLWILVFSYCVLHSTFPVANCNSPRPLIIALPIRLHGSQQFRSVSPTEHDMAEDESAEEQQREQRIVPRTYIPNAGMYQKQQQFQEDEQNSKPQPAFLTWNPGNKMMVLQINDFIGVRNEDSSESVEENERAEEPASVTQRHNWGFQGAYDFEDSRRLPNSNYKEDQRSSRTSSKKRKKTEKNQSSEDTDDDVFGTDPVVHFMRNRSKNKGKHFDLGEMSDEPGDEFNFKEWWSY